LRTDRAAVNAVRAEFARRDLHIAGPSTRPGVICATTVRHYPGLSRYEITVYDGVLAGVAL